MDGVSVGSNRTQETFDRCTTASATLARLATLMQQVESKQQLSSQGHVQPHHHPCVCPECGQDFLCVTDLLHHQHRQHTLPKPHRCASCGLEFSLKSSLDLHKCKQSSTPCVVCQGQTRLNSPCPACMICSVVLEKPRSLYRQPLLLNSYVCAPCGRGFSQKQALLHHQQSDCIDKPLQSGSDGSGESTPGSQSSSGRSNSPGPRTKAVSVAQLSFNPIQTNMRLQLHKCSDHAVVQLKPQERTSHEVETSTRSDGVSCVKTGKSESLFRCRSCDMEFSDTVLLHKHRRIKHSRENNVITEPWNSVRIREKKTMYPCPQCNKVFMHHLSLSAHMKQHSNNSSTLKGESSQKDLMAAKLVALKNNHRDRKTDRPGRGRPRKIPRVINRRRENMMQVDTEESEEEQEVVMEEVVEVEESEEEVEEKEEDGREFPCPSCAEVFPLQYQLKQHEELHLTAMRRRQCSVCLDEMDPVGWSGSRRRRLYHCVPCQEGFSVLDHFLEHCQEHLRARVEEESIVEGYTHLFGKC
ncbi:uncharacterized protein ACB058_018388 isoform 1-T2 [Synchiropus picturatus]